MPEGTGLNIFRDHFPEKYYDVGICESVAVDIAAGMAKAGIRPFVCIYSTFLQRAFDQIAHDIALQNLPVVFCIDRAGVVGDDGPTHHGMLDIAFLRAIPKMVLCAPASGSELREAIIYAAKTESPLAIRYPRDILPESLEKIDTLKQPFKTGKSIKITDCNCDIVLLSYGAMLEEVMSARDLLEEAGVLCDIVNARFAKPIDREILQLAKNGKTIFTIEDHGLMCGFGSAILECLSEAGINTEKVHCLAAPDDFVEKATRKKQLERCNVGSRAIADKVLKIVKG